LLSRQEANRAFASRDLSVSDASVYDCVPLRIREARKAALSSNGGDYERWINMTQIAPCVFEVAEDWSAEWPIRDYCHLEGYVVLTAKDLETLESLDLDD